MMNPPMWHDLGNDSYLGPIIDQGNHCTCWSISVTNSLDIVNHLKRTPTESLYSPQEILNFYGVKEDIRIGYYPECALEFIFKRGVSFVGKCRYRGLLEKDDPQITHHCARRAFPLKNFKYYNVRSPEWQEESFWRNYLPTLLCQQPVVMGFAVGSGFREWSHKKTKVYDPYEIEPVHASTEINEGLSDMILGEKYGTRFRLETIEGDEEDEMRDQMSEFDDNVEDMDIDEETQKDPKYERNDGMLIDEPNDPGKMNDRTCHECFLAKSLGNEQFCRMHYWNLLNPVYNHVMPVTAYDMRPDAMYWEGKNAYGTNWGDGGYVRIRMNQERNPVVAVYVPMTN